MGKSMKQLITKLLLSLLCLILSCFITIFMMIVGFGLEIQSLLAIVLAMFGQFMIIIVSQFVINEK